MKKRKPNKNRGALNRLLARCKVMPCCGGSYRHVTLSDRTRIVIGAGYAFWLPEKDEGTIIKFYTPAEGSEADDDFYDPLDELLSYVRTSGSRVDVDKEVPGEGPEWRPMPRGWKPPAFVVLQS